MEIKVSELHQADRKDWERLYRDYAVFYKTEMTTDILDSVWSWIFDSNNTFYALIAKNTSDKAVGMMHYREMPSPLRGRQIGFLDDLFVDPTCRGEGVVEALFDNLKKSAKNKGWPTIRWITAENNYRGRAVYDKLSEKTHWVTYQLPIN